jgi:hypothetical protein
MFLINVGLRQTTPVLLLGTTSSAVGITLIAWACHTQYTNLTYGMMALTGFGVGLNINPATLHALAYFPDMTAPIICLTSFVHPFGGTITLTIMSTVFNNRSGTNHEDPKSGIVWAFIAVMPIVWLAVLITTFLGNVWIRKDGDHEVVHGSWFWNTVTGRRLEKVRLARTGDVRSLNGNTDIHLKPVAPGASEAGINIEQRR